MIHPELSKSDLDNDKRKQVGEKNNKEATEVHVP